jgi:hypothetical protein
MTTPKSGTWRGPTAERRSAKRSSFAVRIRPRLAKPSDDAAGVVVVGNSVGEEDGGFRRRVSGDSQGGADGEVGVLMDPESFAVIAGIAAVMEGQEVVSRA